MQARALHIRLVVAMGAAVALLGSAWLTHAEWTRQRNAFDTQARIVHRLLSQQMVQHEAVLSTLTLLPPAPAVAVPLTAVYPHVRQVQVVAREPLPTTPAADAPALSATPPVSDPAPQVTLASANWASGRYSLTAVGSHSTVNMAIDLTQWVHPPEWPGPSTELPLAVDLVLGQQVFVLQPPNRPSWEWQLEATKTIASVSQPFGVITRTHLTWAHLPWARLGAWWLAVAAAAVMRADNAGPHTLGASEQKAFTSASAKNATLAMMEGAQKNPAAANLVHIPGFLLLGGGVPVKVGAETIGAIGVGGAPGGHLDEQCALAALDKAKDLLK